MSPLLGQHICLCKNHRSYLLKLNLPHLVSVKHTFAVSSLPLCMFLSARWLKWLTLQMLTVSRPCYIIANTIVKLSGQRLLSQPPPRQMRWGHTCSEGWSGRIQRFMQLDVSWVRSASIDDISYMPEHNTLFLSLAFTKIQPSSL